MAYFLSPLADDDAFEIIRNAERHSIKQARTLDQKLNALLDQIDANPGIGALKPDIRPGPFRFKLFAGRWWIVYRDVPKGQDVEIIRILHVHDDLANELLD